MVILIAVIGFNKRVHRSFFHKQHTFPTCVLQNLSLTRHFQREIGGYRLSRERANFSTAFGYASLILHPDKHLIVTKHMVFL